MAINVIFVLMLIFAFLIAYSSQTEIKYAQFGPLGATSAVKYFPFGSKVEIYCEQKRSSKTNITIYDNGFINIVENSVLLDRFLDTYQYDVINSTTSLFTINNLTRQLNDTLYTCQSDLQLFATTRGFNPINDVTPLCSPSTPSRFVFEDSVQSDIEMNCTSEEGDPPVMMSIYFRDGDEINDVTSNLTRTVTMHPHPFKTLSFSSYFNSSFNNSVFVCNVSQQLPAPYQRYQGSCSFGPILFLPLFSVTATPSTIDFSVIRNAIFRCTSNVSEVNLTWTNIPSHWEYDIIERDTYIELTVSDTGSGVYSGDIQCLGNYINRNITSMIQILHLFFVAVTPSEKNFSKVKNHIFKCTSNVSEVNLTWTNIPSHWKYDINKGDKCIELNVTDTGSDVFSVDIQCVGYYGDKVITTTVHISYSPLSVLVTNLAIYLTLVIIIIVVVCVAVVFLLYSRVYVTNSQQSKGTTQLYYAPVDVLPGILPTENHVNINSSSFTYDSGGYLSPCEPLQDDEQYAIVK